MKEAMELALEALQVATTPLAKDRQEVLRAIKALEEALAKQEQGEPVATDVEWLARRTDAAYNAGYKEGVKDAHAKQEQGEPVAWAENDMAYRPNGLPQEFIHHEVESPDDWSEWVCPKPEQYFLKCCDCGLVHEAQFRVAKYGEGDYCELVEDKDTQAQFRMRRRTTPQQRTWVKLTDDEMYKVWLSVDEENDRMAFGKAVEAKLKEKNT